MSIFVQLAIRASMEELWHRTQHPGDHQRWDLRFDSIQYLPRADPSLPQRFRYATRIGFGLEIRGEGETTAVREAQGHRTSSLKFWSDDFKSLIRRGSGYWKYVEGAGQVDFLTRYDYQVRFGGVGRIFDKWVFRPLLGWATAWSFDRLRLWIEQGIDPAVSLQRSLIHSLARLTVAFVWVYQGLVPKWLSVDADEILLLSRAGIPPEWVLPVLGLFGTAELAFGLIVLTCWRSRWPLVLTVPFMTLALFGVSISAPQFLVAAFNPVSLNVLMISVCLIGLISLRDLPSASRCHRAPPRDS